MHNAILAGGSHHNHLQNFVTSVSAFAQGTATMNGGHANVPVFHPVIPHIHHPQPLPFHPVHHSHAHQHHPHLLAVQQPLNNDFYKNSHLMNNIGPNLLHPNIHSHMNSSLPTPGSNALTAPLIVTSSHSTVSHHHYSPKSSSSTIEPPQDSISPPLIVDSLDNVASPQQSTISISSNSNNNNNNINSNNNNNHKTKTESISALNNNKLAESSNKKNEEQITATSLQSGTRNESNSLMDILMNPDKCQVRNYIKSIFQR